MKEALIELLEEVFFSNGFHTSITGWVSRIIFYGTLFSIGCYAGYYSGYNLR